jgi:hypothetical protein
VKPDARIVLIVAIAVAVSVVFGVALEGLMALTHIPIPDPFDRLVTYLAGVLSGFLISTKGSGEEPTPVVGPTGGPVETVDVEDPKPAKAR